MVLAAGIVGFILGVNVGFLFAGLMRAAREEQKQTREEKEQTREEKEQTKEEQERTKDENGTG